MASQTDEIWVQEGEIRRKLEGEELSSFIAHRQELIAKELADLEAKQTAKETAEAKLSALGLTADDLKALGL